MLGDRPLILAIAMVAAAASAPDGQAPVEPTARPSLSGRWQLNVKESEDARAKMWPAGRGRGGFGGGGRRGGPGGGGRPEGDSREGMRAMLDAPAEMTITHTDAEIAVLEKDGRLRALHPDGKGYKDSAGAEVKTRWDGDRLVVETRRERRPKVVEAFALESDPRRLVVSVTLEPPSGDRVTVRRVYDPVTAE